MKNKVVLIGPNAVGKSALAVQFVQKQFLSSYDPTIEDIYHIQHKVSKKVLDIELIDTSGTEQFSALKENYLRSGSLILLVFSLSSNRSFQTIQNILIKYKSNFELLPASSVILIGNKSDEEREVPTSEVEKLLQFNNFAYIETSAKTNSNINECLSIIKNFHEQRNRKEIDATSSSPKAIRRFHLLKSKLQSAKLFDH